MIYYYELIIIY